MQCGARRGTTDFSRRGLGTSFALRLNYYGQFPIKHVTILVIFIGGPVEEDSLLVDILEGMTSFAPIYRKGREQKSL